MTISCGSLADDLRLLQLPISHTLLHEALSSGQPCVVHNTTKLLEVRQGREDGGGVSSMKLADL